MLRYEVHSELYTEIWDVQVPHLQKTRHIQIALVVVPLHVRGKKESLSSSQTIEYNVLGLRYLRYAHLQVLFPSHNIFLGALLGFFHTFENFDRKFI